MCSLSMSGKPAGRVMRREPGDDMTPQYFDKPLSTAVIPEQSWTIPLCPPGSLFPMLTSQTSNPRVSCIVSSPTSSTRKAFLKTFAYSVLARASPIGADSECPVGLCWVPWSVPCHTRDRLLMSLCAKNDEGAMKA